MAMDCAAADSARPLHRRQLLRAGLAAALPAFARPAWSAAPKPLLVGGLPVTCNLTLPVACVARAASSAANSAGAQFEFEYSKSTAGPRSRNR